MNEQTPPATNPTGDNTLSDKVSAVFTESLSWLENIKAKFAAGKVPAENDFATLIAAIYNVMKAVGQAPDAPGFGAGLENDTDGKLAVNPAENLKFTDNKLDVDFTRVQQAISKGPGIEIKDKTVAVSPTGNLKFTGNKLDVDFTRVQNKLTAGNGIEISGNNITPKVWNDNNVNSGYVGATGKDSNGLWLKTGSGSYKKGLTGYKDGGNNAILGIDHNDTLKFDPAGKIGVDYSDQDLAMKFFCQVYSADYYDC